MENGLQQTSQVTNTDAPENWVDVNPAKGSDVNAPENWVDASTDSHTETPYEAFKASTTTDGTNSASSPDRASMGTPKPKEGQSKEAPKGNPTGKPFDSNLEYPHEDLLNAFTHQSEGMIWNTIASPFKKAYGQDANNGMDEYLNNLNQKHPISNVVSGIVPFLASATFFPQSLIPSVWSRLAFQFGYLGYSTGVGKVVNSATPMTPVDLAKTIGVETAKQVAYAPFFASSPAIQIINRPVVSALARAGYNGLGMGSMTAAFGENVTEAFKQTGIGGVLSLFMEAPHLAGTVIGRGVIARQNAINPKTTIDPDSPDIVNQIKQSVEETMQQHKDFTNPQIVAATIKTSDGTPYHGTTHEEALAKMRQSKGMQPAGDTTHLSDDFVKGLEEQVADLRKQGRNDVADEQQAKLDRIKLRKSQSGIKPITIEDFNQQQKPLDTKDIKVEPELISKVNDLQNVLGKQIKISSGFRTPEYNQLLKDQGYNVAEKSLHLSGRAADIPVTKDLTHQEIVDAAHQVGLDVEAIKLTPKHVHVELPTKNTPTFELEPKPYEKGFTVLHSDGKIDFINQKEAQAEPFNIKDGDPKNVPGLLESKFLKQQDIKIVNPETLANSTGTYSDDSTNQYVKNTPLDISFGKNDKATSKSLRLEYAGNKNEQIVRGNQLADDIKRLVPDKEERQAMFWYKAAEGNTDLLLEMLSEEAMKPYTKQVKRAFNLSPEALRALDMINKYYDEAGQVATEVGTIRDVRENYQNRIYKPEPPKDYVSNEIKKGLKQTTSHAKRRVYDNEFDAIMGGKQFATTDVADALSIHNEEMARVNTARKLADAMVESKLGAWRKPDNIPEGWEQVGTISKSVPLKDQKGQALIGEDGNQIVSKSVFVAPEGIVDGLKAIVEPNYVSRIDSLRGIQKYQGIVKTVDLSLSFFHHLTMAAQTLYQGGLRTFMSAPVMDRMMQSESFAEMERDMVKHGGMTSKVEANQDILRKLIEHDGSLGSKIEGLPVIKQYLNTTEKMGNFLFGKIQRYLKVMDYNEKVSVWASKNGEATNEEVKSAKESIAKQINAAYGGLNWEALGITKSNLSLLRLGLLAPDWTISNAQLLKFALSEKGPAGDISRKHILTALVGGMVLTEGINQLLTGHTTDKNPKGHAMEIQIAPGVYVSLLRGGIGDISKFVSMVYESGGAGAIRFAQGKLSPFARTGVGLLAAPMGAVDYTGHRIVRRDANAFSGTYDVLKYMIKGIAPVPFAAGNAVQYLFDKNKTLAGAAAVATGVGRYSIGKDKVEKEMTPYRERQLAKDSQLDSLQKQTKHMSFTKVAELYQNADDKDKKELRTILDKKMQHKQRIQNWTDSDEKLYQQSIGQ